VLEILYHKGPIPLGQLSQSILVTGASTNYTVNNQPLRTAASEEKPSGQQSRLPLLLAAGDFVLGRPESVLSDQPKQLFSLLPSAARSELFA